jgi:hypothetical protein
LIGARRGFCSTAYAIQALNDIVNLLAFHQPADTLQIAVAATIEYDILNDVIVI